MSTDYWLYGSNTSPYSRKLRALMRYRRLPYVWVPGTAETLPELATLRPRLIPVLRLPETGELQVDSTPLAHLLERRHPNVRTVIPPTPGEAFLCHLIEDYADEWLTKLMFHFRWFEETTARWAAGWVVRDALPRLPPAAQVQAAALFYERQRGRMPRVGCTAENAPILEADYLALLGLLEPHFNGQRYLFGSRPSLADFALMGQLSQLVTDPWPQRLCRARAPGVEAWVVGLEDASGVEGDWQPALMAPLREALLRQIGQRYLPFLQANAEALAEQRNDVRLRYADGEYCQPAFPYQRRCLAALREHWSGLPPDERAQLAPLLADTGCLPVLDQKV